MEGHVRHVPTPTVPAAKNAKLSMDTWDGRASMFTATETVIASLATIRKTSVLGALHPLSRVYQTIYGNSTSAFAKHLLGRAGEKSRMNGSIDRFVRGIDSLLKDQFIQKLTSCWFELETPE